MLRTKSFQKPLIVVLGLTLATFLTAKPSTASVFTYQGDTTNQPIWRRTAPGDPPILITGERDGTLGMSVRYSVFEFIVDQSGLYTFTSAVPGATSPTNGDWDNFLVLYQDSFSPTRQLTNALVASTAPNDGTVALSRELDAQRQYFLVTTGRRVADFGAFTNTISGSGQIVPVPELNSIPAMLVVVGVGSILFG
ncbi:PEP-CTERM sorting domain-containing protein [Fortiea sp. LEGE XX443]|uniref:PEP-CTERM sorting domain-containing protein n=1 Tax=Fortiea sp. LEGE XX443 TaxID=1828611 RepID=UPI0018806F04|nr:PEP-CTERM sorting domain-containing protein [Fortiea sp. LEGE XX443]MBE9005337.1 PEP-CTERM sorting domain-containing protein [Fortiea sp. LEGE XX443]